MTDEVTADMDKDKLYLSSNFNDQGRKLYPELLLNSIKSGDGYTLESALIDRDCILKEKPKAGGGTRKVESDAARKTSQSEFNRYYVRGVCLKAIAEGIENVEIYRAKESSNPRQTSESKIGDLISAKNLLDDLRQIGSMPNIFPEVNSGLSVRIPKK